MSVCFNIYDLSVGLRRLDCVRSPGAGLKSDCKSPNVGPGK